MVDAANETHSTSPVWLRIVSVLGLLWYLFGLSQFSKNVLMDVPAAVATGEISQAHGMAITATPFYIWVAYFAACILGVLGAIQLFRSHSSAFKLFLMSLILDVIYFGWFYASGTASARPTEAGPIAALVITIALVFTFLSWRNSVNSD